MGAMQGIWMAEQAMEKERLDQANLDLRTKSEDRLDKQFKENFTNNRYWLRIRLFINFLPSRV